MMLVSEVKIEKEKKTIILSSSYRISNHVNQTFKVCLSVEERNLELLLPFEKTIYIPVDFVEGTISLEDENNKNETSEKQTIKDFFKSADKNPAEIHVGNAVIFGGCSSLDERNEAYKMTLITPFRFKNCCPVKLCYQIYSSRNLTDTTKYYLNPQEKVHQTKFIIKDPLFMRIQLPGYKWSEEIILHSPNKKEKAAKEVKLEDENGKRISFFIFITGVTDNEDDEDDDQQDEGDDKKGGSSKVYPNKPKKFFFYIKGCVINETSFDLQYSTSKKDDESKLKEQKTVSLQALAQTKVDDKKQLQLNPKVQLINQGKSLTIRLANDPILFKKIDIGPVGDTVANILSLDGASLLELGVSTSLVSCDAKQLFLTKMITISPRYVLINLTDYELGVKFENASEAILVLDKDAKARTPLYWTPLDSNKANSASFR